MIWVSVVQPQKTEQMKIISCSAFRAQLSSVLDKVNDDHKPMMITRQNGKAAVVMSLEDFNACEETAYLMASPKNAERLSRAVAELEAGRNAEKDVTGE